MQDKKRQIHRLCLAARRQLPGPFMNHILSVKIPAFLLLAFMALDSRATAAQPEGSNPAVNISENVSAVEDLMREHGALGRILLIYEAELRDIDAGKEPSCRVLFKAAKIVRNFVENYHEKLEEDLVFPRFEKAGKLADLAKVLREQHSAGRRLTDVILDISKPGETGGKSRLLRLRDALRAFIAMYRPHKAREDTILFPALHEIVSQKEYAELGERFEDREQELFGKDGFESMVRAIGELEKELNIYDLSGFTAK
jgi:hemerythrin-like domain-containing protein